MALFAVLLAACAQSKAFIDTSASGQLIWPAPPDPPRIRYLWSVTEIAAASEGRRMTDLAFGDATDPRTSNTLMRPYGVFVDSREKLYIADPGAFRVAVVDLKTSDVVTITEVRGEEFLSPISAVADEAGRMYVSDSELRKVFVLDEKGSHLSQLEGGFKRPTCLAIDLQRLRLYVSDTAEHTIYAYSLDGKRIGSIGSPGSQPGMLNFPTHLFVDKEGFLYVTDSMNFRVQIFRPDGTFLTSVGTHGDTQANLDKPKGVAADSHGNIYVVDSIGDTVKIFDRQGSLLLFFGERGNNLGEFWLPSGIFIDTANRIYIADTYNMRVQVFQFVEEAGGKTAK